MKGARMSGRDLQRARKTAARQKDDAYVAVKLENARMRAALERIAKDSGEAWAVDVAEAALSGDQEPLRRFLERT